MAYIPGLVSIVVPCYNSERYIEDALRSARNQTYRDLEIVVVDDGSTDHSRQIIERHAERDSRIHVVSQPNRGLSSARNAGIEKARGEFVCFLDADDALLKDKLARQVEYLRDNPECDLVYSDWYTADARLNVTGFVVARMPDGDLMEAYARRNWFAPMAPLTRRELLDRVGLFDTSLRASEDYDYWIRCARAGAFGYLPGAAGIYRTHAAQMHFDSARMLEAGKRAIKKHFYHDPRLYGLAMSCFYWASAKGSFHSRHYLRAALYVAASEYYSRLAGGVKLHVRDIDTKVLPAPAGAAAFERVNHA